MPFLKIPLLFILILTSQLSWASVYPTDQFNLNKLCISNPWNGTNYKGDATSAYPCHYDYAIIHAPTFEAEIQTRISNAVALAVAQQQAQCLTQQQSLLTSNHQSLICPSIWSFSGSYEDARQLGNVILGLFAIVFIIISVKKFFFLIWKSFVARYY